MPKQFSLTCMIDCPSDPFEAAELIATLKVPWYACLQSLKEKGVKYEYRQEMIETRAKPVTRKSLARKAAQDAISLPLPVDEWENAGMSAPSPYAMEQAMSVLLSVRARLLEKDPDLADDERLMADMLDGETDGAMEVIHRYVRAALHAASMAEAAKKRAADIAARAARYAKREGDLRGGVFAAMEALGLRKIEQPDFSASVSAGVASVVITDEDALPDAFVRVTRAPDRMAIGQAIKTGEVVPGAEMSNGLPRLTVRVR